MFDNFELCTNSIKLRCCLLVRLGQRVNVIRCDTDPHIWCQQHNFFLFAFYWWLSWSPAAEGKMFVLVTTQNRKGGQNGRSGGWWGRERPSLSRGKPWCSQGGEGKTGPDGILKRWWCCFFIIGHPGLLTFYKYDNTDAVGMVLMLGANRI